jgi:hypothetical protein
MVALDVPYAESANGYWSVLEGRMERAYFVSRVHALGFAVTEAKRFEQDGQAVALNIEGADGSGARSTHA